MRHQRRHRKHEAEFSVPWNGAGLPVSGAEGTRKMVQCPNVHFRHAAKPNVWRFSKCPRRQIQRWLSNHLLLSAIMISCGLAGPLRAQETEADGYYQKSFPVVDRVRVLRQGPGFHMQVIGNVTVVEQSDGLVLVDAGGTPGAGRRVVELVRSNSSKPVKAIIVTHWHGDHHFGLSAVLKAWPQALVVATDNTRIHMNTRGLPTQAAPAYDETQERTFEKLRTEMEASSTSPKIPEAEHKNYADAAREVKEYEKDFRGVSIRYATITFDHRITFPDELAPVEVMFLGKANTDGDAVVWLPKQKVIAAGDIVVSPVPFGGGSYPGEWAKVLASIHEFDYKVLIPGHGLPQTSKAYVEELISALQDVNSQVQAQIKQGVTIEQVQEKMDFTRQRNALVHDNPWLTEFLERDWEPVAICAYQEQKGIAILQGKGCQPPVVGP
jgi:glyoxylase-like metal-dependent hydrolase (beta-lactamase superfamily II)